MIEKPTHGRTEDDGSRGKYATLRQILNIVFMIGAVAGVIVYLNGNRTVGTIVILASMVFKFAECVLRLLK